jgi:hypothetical protein
MNTPQTERVSFETRLWLRMRAALSHPQRIQFTRSEASLTNISVITVTMLVSRFPFEFLELIFYS